MSFLLPLLGDSQHDTIRLDASGAWGFVTTSAWVSIAAFIVTMYIYHLLVFSRTLFLAMR